MKRPVRRALIAFAILMALVVGGSQSASGDEEAPPWEGLPYLGFDPDRMASYSAAYGWLGGVQIGMTGASKAKQWSRLPLTMMAFNATWDAPVVDDDPPWTGYSMTDDLGYFVSPAGSKNNYGDSAVITVRTVAFGSIPAEVDLQVGQQRAANGDPVGIHVFTKKRQYPAQTQFDRVDISERVHLRVTRLRVDGVDVGLRTGCETARLAELNASVAQHVHNTPPFDENRDFDPETMFLVMNGGTFRGNVKIPPFAGCTTRSGDDVAPVLTSAISSDDNPVTLRIGAPYCFVSGDVYKPPAPGQNTPASANCGPDPDPAAPQIKVVPDQLPFPSHAP